MANLLDLAKRMDRLADLIPLKTNELKHEIARIVHRDLLTVTPVDTSEALSNWVLTSEEPWAVPLPPHYEGIHGSTQAESINAALIAGEQQLKLNRPGESIFISNNAPHIKSLNEGSSGQAPAGFVERSVLYGRKIVEARGLKLKD